MMKSVFWKVNADLLTTEANKVKINIYLEKLKRRFDKWSKEIEEKYDFEKCRRRVKNGLTLCLSLCWYQQQQHTNLKLFIQCKFEAQYKNIKMFVISMICEPTFLWPPAYYCHFDSIDYNFFYHDWLVAQSQWPWLRPQSTPAYINTINT